MGLSVRKVNDVYIFYGGYKVKHIPKYHKFKWDPDNNYWYTYDTIIAQVLLKCLLKPANCTHLEAYYENLKLEQEAKLNPIMSNEDWFDKLAAIPWSGSEYEYDKKNLNLTSSHREHYFAEYPDDCNHCKRDYNQNIKQQDLDELKVTKRKINLD